MSMDALEFINERNRMCKASTACAGCALSDKSTGLCSKWCFDHPEEAVAAVEKWAEEHPRKTRQSEFLKRWPNAQLDENDNIKVCPKLLMGVAPSNNGQGCICSCYTCREDFWSQEVE